MARNIYKTIVLGAVGLGATAGVVGLAAAALGFINVSARPPHLPVTTFALHGVFKASMARAGRSSPEAPDLTDDGLIHLGAQHYAQVCSSCHGGPELGQSPVALSMRPRPQHLPVVVDQFEDGKLYEILRNGVRFSAMPAWPADQNFDEIWSVVAFLRQLPDMSAAEYAEMTQVDTTDPANAMAWDERGEAVDLTLRYANAEPVEEYLYAAPATGWRPIGLNDAPIAYCAACHGDDGTGDVTGGHAPNLTIHSSDFIAQRLRDYASGAQASGIMATVASTLSEPQIDALAEYYSGLSPAVQPAVTVDALGEQIALAGAPDAPLPSCASCHSEEARGTLTYIPAVAGQNQTFLERRLHNFRTSSGTVGGGFNPMHAFALQLSDEDITAVSTYLAGLAPDDPLMPAPLQANPQLAVSTIEGSCSTCHEPNLNGGTGARIPNLTLQSSAYVKWQLQQFYSGDRENSQMRQAAQRLDPETIDALAHYIGNLTAIPSNDGDRWDPSSAEQVESAATLVMNGDPDRGIAACSSCHINSTDAVQVIPRLSGQQPAYLFERLQHFSHEGRSDVIENSPMWAISSRLTVDERRALADYFSGHSIQVKP